MAFCLRPYTPSWQGRGGAWILALGLQAYITTSYPGPLGKKKSKHKNNRCETEELQSYFWFSGPPEPVVSRRLLGKLAWSAVDWLRGAG